MIAYPFLYLLLLADNKLENGLLNNSITNSSNDELGDRQFIPKGVIEDGIYWSSELESRVPKGFTSDDDRNWLSLVNSKSAVKLSEGCGSQSNRLVMFEDGILSCVRHRQNNDQIQGDIFSFHLARLLGIKNLPPAALSNLRKSSSSSSSSSLSTNGGQRVGLNPVWNQVKSSLNSAKWSTDKPVVVTRWIPDLIPAHIPMSLRRSSEPTLHPTNNDLLGDNLTKGFNESSVNLTYLTDLVQWSDLVIFDYLTGNLDRVVNNMVNRQWNPEMMDSPAHNLVKVKSTGLLLFLDNESGLLHGYRLLKKYEPYHRKILNGTCVFRRSTVDALEKLHRDGNIVQLLRNSLHETGYTPKSYNLPFLPDRNGKVLKSRLAIVIEQINKCRSLFGSCENPPCALRNDL